jgi:hypothetical protein
MENNYMYFDPTDNNHSISILKDKCPDCNSTDFGEAKIGDFTNIIYIKFCKKCKTKDDKVSMY